ncbi:hypothetical protein [Microbacterium marmarense]|uniref:DUF998 domain-containing protein n=2 Tax=Microbacterium TaxID=33882 RepID=A0ABU8LY72_9MICO
MATATPTTSLMRTYRYLRIGIAGTIIALFVSVGISATQVGLLPSLSNYYFTPARDAFVGALIAASLALFALSGRGVERALLDAAALFAPLIAFIPTTLGPGNIARIVVPCEFRCFPPEYEAIAAAGVITYLVMGVLTVILVLILARRRQVSLGAVSVSLTFAIIVLLTLAIGWIFFRDFVLDQGHAIATVAFFSLFAAVAVRGAFPRLGAPPRRTFKAAYILIAFMLVLVLGVYVYAELNGYVERIDFPVALIAETVALALFGAFWIVQCVELWDEPDPAASRVQPQPQAQPQA